MPPGPDPARHALAERLFAAQVVPDGTVPHPDWPRLAAAATARLVAHGDLPRWQAALAALPALPVGTPMLGARVGVRGSIDSAQRECLTAALRGLHPWRKGPFELYGVHVDAEWRSDLKWQRIAAALGPLSGQTVLDVGCGNAYFAWRALEAGAEQVLGIDPSVLFFLQHLAIRTYLDPCVRRSPVLLPIPFEDLPTHECDLVLSMGVIYHRPEPAEHVARLFACTRPGGRLLLESLIVRDGPAVRPGRRGRYARMRNVSVVPTLDMLERWLEDAGFVDIACVDVTVTTPVEQRTTQWMTFESLAESLAPGDSGRTVEGHPAPVRAALLARRPGPIV